MKTLIKLATAAIGVSLSTASLAEGWNIGVLGGKTEFDDYRSIGCFGNGGTSSTAPGVDFCQIDDDSNAIGLNIGYQFNSTFGVELGYTSFDDFSSDITIGGDVLVGEFEAEPEVIHAAFLSTLPITERLSITGRVGYYELDTNISGRFESDVVFNDTISKDDVYFGASLNYDITDSLTAQLRYDNFDVDLVAFGLNYSFGY